MRPRCPAIRTWSTPRWATTSSPPDRCSSFLYEDARIEDSSHDFGRDILPKWVQSGEVFAYDFGTNRIPGDPVDSQVYWRDVGTIDAYYDATMDLRAVAPVEKMSLPIEA